MEWKTQPQITAFPDDSRTTESDREFIRRTYEIAKNAVFKGNHPFGALLVHQGKNVAEFENAVVTSRDVTQHAETGLVAEVTKQFASEVLRESTLYTSTECCVMCCGAIHWAGIPRLVYGVTGSQARKVLGREYTGIPSREIFQRIDPKMIVVGPVMEDDGLKVHLLRTR
ncbi:MAG: nucleoside deaminase [Deltaproteobacteria bacterium]|nr:nucleoside deaminase [Deltaproteobacteria bacterium]